MLLTRLLSPLFTHDEQHWDLRLACRLSPGSPDGTLSWAIPRGFDDWSPGERRLAVETPLHSIGYSCFEGVSEQFGTTLISDFGTYTVKASLASRKAGRDADSSTSDESASENGSVGENEAEELQQGVMHGTDASAGAHKLLRHDGSKEEEALRKALARKAVVLELQGMRYKLRVTLRYHSSVATGT